MGKGFPLPLPMPFFDPTDRIMKECEANVRKYFFCCPLCGSGRIHVLLVEGGKDAVFCENCGAGWHIHINSWGHLKWAKLEMDSDDKKGRELLRKEIEVDKWQARARALRSSKENLMYCRYCGVQNYRDANFCEKCGRKF